MQVAGRQNERLGSRIFAVYQKTVEDRVLVAGCLFAKQQFETFTGLDTLLACANFQGNQDGQLRQRQILRALQD